MHFGYKATYERWPSKEYDCQTKCKDSSYLRRANLSTQARIAIMTLAGNSLSFGDVRKACKRYADEFLRDPKQHDAHKSHAVHVSQEKKEARVATEE